MIDHQKQVTIGSVYAVQHKRKGHFVGQLIDVVDGDEHDPVLLRFKIDVRPGTDQARIAHSPGEAVAVRDIRPSLVVSIEAIDTAQWLRVVKVPEEVRAKSAPLPQASLGARLRSLLKH
jgi:hypothetical protein